MHRRARPHRLRSPTSQARCVASRVVKGPEPHPPGLALRRWVFSFHRQRASWNAASPGIMPEHGSCLHHSARDRQQADDRHRAANRDARHRFALPEPSVLKCQQTWPRDMYAQHDGRVRSKQLNATSHRRSIRAVGPGFALKSTTVRMKCLRTVVVGRSREQSPSRRDGKRASRGNVACLQDPPVVISFERRLPSARVDGAACFVPRPVGARLHHAPSLLCESLKSSVTKFSCR